MRTRKLLINAIVSGNIKEVKRLQKLMTNKNFSILVRPDQNDKGLFYAEIEGIKKNFSALEVEELKKEYLVIQLNRATGSTSGNIATCEEEIED